MDKIKFEQIKIFLEVAKTLSFTKASENLYISQPTVTKWINRLEDELNIKLFERTSRQVALTEAGEQLFIKWTTLYDAFEMSVRTAQALDQSKSREIKLGILHHFDYEEWVLEMGFDFESSTSDYSLNYSVYNFKELKSKANALDIIFTTDLEAESMQDYNMKIISQMTLYLVVSKKHHLADRKSVSMADVKDETFYIFSPETSPKGIARVKKAFAEKNISPHLVAVDNTASQFVRIIRKNGVAIINKGSAKGYEKDVVVIPFSDLTLKLYHVCLWHKNDHKASTEVFLKFFNEYLEKNR